MARRLKLEEFFNKYRKDEQELFDYLLMYGAGYLELRLLLWYWNTDASPPAIARYAKRKGLWTTRQKAIAARKSKRKFLRKDRSFSTEIYKELIRHG